MQNQPGPPFENLHPEYDRDTHPIGIGLANLIDNPDPAWGDVITGIWNRLTHPLPGSA